MFKGSRIASTMIFFLFQVMMNKGLFSEKNYAYIIHVLKANTRYTLNMLDYNCVTFIYLAL